MPAGQPPCGTRQICQCLHPVIQVIEWETASGLAYNVLHVLLLVFLSTLQINKAHLDGRHLGSTGGALTDLAGDILQGWDAQLIAHLRGQAHMRQHHPARIHPAAVALFLEVFAVCSPANEVY